jgi:hypothetical protein
MSDNYTNGVLPRIQYVADGAGTAFAFPFEVCSGNDLAVYVGNDLATGYFVNGVLDPAGGSVVFAEPPAAGDRVTLIRHTDAVRGTIFRDGGPFRAASVNAEFDRLLFLSQEARADSNDALRISESDPTTDLTLPPATARANRVLGFDSGGHPVAIGVDALPQSGDAGAATVVPAGAVIARTLSEHLSSVVNVRDFGALGDGGTDDASAFRAAITAATARGASTFVPASATPYVLGSTIALDGTSFMGDGAGSVLLLAQATGVGLSLAGRGTRLANLRLLGPGAVSWPATAGDVDLAGVLLEAIEISSGAEDARIHGVDVAACHTGLAVRGGAGAIDNCAFRFMRNGIDLQTGARGVLPIAACSVSDVDEGLVLQGDAGLSHVAIRGGSIERAGTAVSLAENASSWRTVDLESLHIVASLAADLEAGPRQSVSVRGSRLSGGGKLGGAALRLLAPGSSSDAPNLTVERCTSAITQTTMISISGGSNLHLLDIGDIIVPDTDPDDVSDTWTVLKATRAAIVRSITSQSTSDAVIEAVVAGPATMLQASDTVRALGRTGTATVDSVSTFVPADPDTWLIADPGCRILATHNAMPETGIQTGGEVSDRHIIPGRTDEAASISGVALESGAVNGALSRLETVELATDTAASVVPPATSGMLMVFSGGAADDPAAGLISYNASAPGHTTLVGGAAVPSLEVVQATALDGMSGSAGAVTVSAHSDGRIYVENRRSGAVRRISLYMIAAPA